MISKAPNGPPESHVPPKRPVPQVPQAPGVRVDADVAAWVKALGRDGLIDIHTHFMPQSVLAKVWEYFDDVTFPDGQGWPITYRGSDAERVDTLRRMSVYKFTALAYAHRPDMAMWLNNWTLAFADDNPGCVPSATFYPDVNVVAYVHAAVDAGARIFKVHLRVGDFDPRLPLLQPVWELIEERRIPVVIHTGSAPEAGKFTGPAIFSDLMRAHPELVAVVAHMGSPEHEDYLRIALEYPSVYLDTTMAFTDFFVRFTDYSPAYMSALSSAGHRVVFGSDFPNIPHVYAHQVQALVRLGFGDDWLRAVCHDNASALFERAYA